MKRYIAMGGSALIAIAGSAGYLVSESSSNAPVDTATDTITEVAKEAEKGRPEPNVKAAPKAASPTDAEKATRIEAKISQIEIGSSYTEVTEIMGAADWTEEQSTDFGYDVIYWYGAWGVYTSNAKVTHIDYYESEA
jgi:hypothetical protein